MLPVLAVLALAGLAAPGAWAQRVRPGDEPPELPSFEPRERAPGRILPPIPLPTEPSTPGMSGGLRVFVRGVHISGNTVLPDEELARLTEPYAEREVSFADLEVLRDRLTLAYVERGYVTSGAVIPDQRIEDGIVEIEIVEGVLGELEIAIDGRLRASYVRDRLERQRDRPVNVYALEKRLQILQQDRRIERLQAELAPGARRGESNLRVVVDEATPVRVILESDNHTSPSIGSWGGTLLLSHADLTGFGDALRVEYWGTEGLQEIETHYEIPLNARDTRLDFHVQATWSDVVEDPFDALDIESRTRTYGFSLRHPVYRSLQSTAELSLTGEVRRSKSLLLGRPFSFSAGPEKGVSKITVLRFGQSWSVHSRRQAFAARSTLSWGLDLLGATSHGGDVPDGQFLTWLGQLQWARRLPVLGARLIARADAQLSTDPLLGLEQFGIGGTDTVRGYRENTLVRDSGVVGSLELRIPVWGSDESRTRVELAPFVDGGYSSNVDRRTASPRTLVSAGIGLLAQLAGRIHLEVYWGESLKNVETGGAWDLQDDGVHVSLAVSFP